MFVSAKHINPEFSQNFLLKHLPLYYRRSFSRFFLLR